MNEVDIIRIVDCGGNIALQVGDTMILGVAGFTIGGDADGQFIDIRVRSFGVGPGDVESDVEETENDDDTLDSI